MSAWKDYVTAALIGAEKTAPPPLPAAVQAPLDPAASLDPTTRFLTHAGALALWRRAGFTPPTTTTEIKPAEAETTREINRTSAAHLRMMLGKDLAILLEEWLQEAARRGRHITPDLLPALLDRARAHRVLRPAVAAAGGQRAKWLAAHNPEWSFSEAIETVDWETGSRDQRVELLKALRATSPAEGRAKVETTWKTEPADTRTAFISALRTGLSDEDAPFLDAALDDRSKEVRKAAVDLLSRLPASPFVARMMERSKPLLVYKKGGLLSKATLEIALPESPDAAGVRDGLIPKGFGEQKLLGEKAVWLVLILSSIPLRHWTDTFNQTPEALVKAVQKSEFAQAVATGWAWAALRQRDAEWADALIDVPEGMFHHVLPDESLFSILPDSARAKRITAALRAGALRKADPGPWHTIAGQLSELSRPWPDALTREVLAALRRDASSGVPWHFREAFTNLLILIPPAMLPEAVDGWPVGEEGVQPLVDLLRFRHEALTTLSQP